MNTDVMMVNLRSNLRVCFSLRSRTVICFRCLNSFNEIPPVIEKYFDIPLISDSLSLLNFGSSKEGATAERTLEE